MGKFDSLTHSMTTIATGGFSNYNQSIGYFNSVYIEISAMVFIILGSIPFIAYIKFLSGNKKIFLNDVQIKSFLKINKINPEKYSIYTNIEDVFIKSLDIIENCNESCENKDFCNSNRLH